VELKFPPRPSFDELAFACFYRALAASTQRHSLQFIGLIQINWSNVSSAV
jgi:hypothetical protein